MINLKKRMFSFVMALCCLSLFSITAFARSYNLSDTDMSIYIDDSEWYVFTRDNILNNSELEDLGITYDYMNDLFLYNKVYVDAMLIYDDESMELFVRKTGIDKIVNLSKYEDDEVLSFAKTLAEKRSIEEYKLYKTDYTFVEFEYTDIGFYIREFLTVVNGENYTLTFQSEAPFSPLFYQKMETIVDSVNFEIDTTLKETTKTSSIFDGVLEKAIGGAVTAAIFSGVGILCGKKRKKSKESKSATIYAPSAPNTPKNDNQNQITHICLSEPNEQPKEQGNFNFYGKDILLDKSYEQDNNSQPNIQEAKTIFTFDSFANSLAKMASQELLNIMNLCSNKQIEIDERKLLVSTFAYFYGVWIFNYKNITMEQEKIVQEIYKKQFSEFNRTAFENDTYKQVVDNEYEFDKLLYYVIKRINESHEKFDGKQSFEYDKLSNEFISEFIVDEKDKERIKLDVRTKILRDWALIASKTGQVSEIQKEK